MAKNKSQNRIKKNKTEKILQNIEESTNKVEQFVERHQKILVGTFIAIIGVGVIYYAYNEFIIKPKQRQAAEDMYSALEFYKKDSLDLALNGDGQSFGLLEIIDEYSGSKTANLAKYYIGTIYLKQEKYDLAVDYLEQFSSDDPIISTLAKANIGDALFQLERYKEATEFYLDAENKNPNEFSSPILLRKAVNSSIALNDWKMVVKIYKKIKLEYPNSKEAEESEKFIARGETVSN